MSKDEIVTLKRATEWATKYLQRKVTLSNISYLIQYGKLSRYDENGELKITSGGITKVSIDELKQYYDTTILPLEERWKQRLGDSVSWELSFSDISESERTKHVHRIHPYKGKFIPQLVEYFLDDHTDQLKGDVFFHRGDTILDPFVGSGTTLVQCMELGLNSIGIDISEFNCLMSQVKTEQYEFDILHRIVRDAVHATENYTKSLHYDAQERCIDEILHKLNTLYYPNPDFKILIKRLQKLEREISKSIKTSDKIEIDTDLDLKQERIQRDAIRRIEQEIDSFFTEHEIELDLDFNHRYSNKIVNTITVQYWGLVQKELEKMIADCSSIQQHLLAPSNAEDTDVLGNDSKDFLRKWYTEDQLREMNFYLNQIEKIDDIKIKNVMQIILSRAVRSCRATKHVDLATLIRPQTDPYYCRKHYKICRPIITITKHLKRYTKDTISRLQTFDKFRKDAHTIVINGDSTKIDIFKHIRSMSDTFYQSLKKRKIDGIFTSPPYLGLIDYHEQHAYAYELFDIERRDDDEIGRMSNGVGQEAKKDYIDRISAVLLNVSKFLKDDAHIFIVANDCNNLYPLIAEMSNLEIVDEFKRPVLNRTERDKQPYSESIFHMQVS